MKKTNKTINIVALLLAFYSIAYFIKYNITFAVTTQFWEQITEDDFGKGEINNISIYKGGIIKLAPKTEQITGINASYVWCIAKNNSNDIFIGTGNPGVVYKITEQKSVEEIFRPSGECHIQSIVIDPEKDVYVATSPNGIIYKIDYEKKSTVLCKLPDFYVWDMVLDSEGNLYAATGPNGKIYHITQNGTMEVILNSEAAHILDLEIDCDNNIYACTEPFGLIYKITPNKGSVEIIYDAKEEEIHSLTITKSGTIFAGTADGGGSMLQSQQNQRNNAMAAMIAQSSGALMNTKNPILADFGLVDGKQMDDSPENSNNNNKNLFAALANSFSRVNPSKTTNSIYKISQNGHIQKIQSLENTFVFNLINNNNTIYIGTANNASIYSISNIDKMNSITNDSSQINTIFNSDHSQILSMLMLDNNEFYVGTGNNASIFKVANQYSSVGIYKSPILDTNSIAKWGRIFYETTTPKGTTITLYTRTGNSQNPNQTWSEWVEISNDNTYKTTNNLSEMIKNPSSRFIQYKAIFSTITSHHSPSLSNVKISYLPDNQPAIIRSLKIENIDDEPAKATTTPQDNPDEVTLFPLPTQDIKAGKEILLKKKITWNVSDPDNDTLQFTIFYKQVDENSWKSMVENSNDQKSYTWDVNNIPDGTYLIKVSVDDQLSNPKDLGLKTEIFSQPILIDKKAPILKDVTIKHLQANEYKISGTVIDEISNISSIKYSIGTNDMIPVFPIDQIFDYKVEDFEITIEVPDTEKETLKISASDSNENIKEEEFTIYRKHKQKK